MSNLDSIDLLAFEHDVSRAYEEGKIRAPVHLAGGNEEQLIELFKQVKPQDWVVVQWRSHYHCLLKGVPREVLWADIIAGRSITLCYPEQRIISSAIAGGHLPIAVGLALAAKRDRSDEHVWVFCGDMVARSGAFHEAEQYAQGHGLPITFIVEDNGLSVMTDTKRAWGEKTEPADVRTYEYELQWPHSGIGKRVEF